MLLESYLELKNLSVPDFGRRLKSISSPYYVRRYLRLNQDGSPNRGFRRPDWPIMLDIYQVSDRLVTPNDWI